MRRLNQLCLNLDSYRPEPYFFYEYDFMWTFVHCYKMSERFIAQTLFPAIRFLLAKYKTCSTIFDKHPDNFAFEMVSHLALFIDILLERIYHLFQQCLNHCRLRRLENDEHISNQEGQCSFGG